MSESLNIRECFVILGKSMNQVKRSPVGGAKS